MKIGAGDLKPLVTKKAAPKRRKRRSRLREVAEEAGMNYDTLKARAKRFPDVPLEELARMPVASKAAAGRAGSREWRKTN